MNRYKILAICKYIMTTLYRYTNEDIKQILFDGFDYTLPLNIERIILIYKITLTLLLIIYFIVI